MLIKGSVTFNQSNIRNKKVLSKLSTLIIKLCFKIISCLSIKGREQNLFPDLCPTTDANNIDEYQKRLNDLLKNRKNTIREIAITSPYSGGKSSFLNTFFKNNPIIKLYEGILLYKNEKFKEAINNLESFLENLAAEILFLGVPVVASVSPEFKSYR